MTSLPPPLTISTLSRPSVSTSRNSMSARHTHSLTVSRIGTYIVMCVAGRRGEERERERETHSPTHRVKDWDLVMCVAGRRGEGKRERETHSLTHRVKDWGLVMCVAGRKGGGREGTRDILTHSQGQGLGPSDVCGREEGRRERGNETHSLTHRVKDWD